MCVVYKNSKFNPPTLTITSYILPEYINTPKKKNYVYSKQTHHWSTMFVKQIALPSRTKSLNQIIRNIFISVPCNTIKSSNFHSTQLASNLSKYKNQVNYSRFSATTIMTGTDLFKISDYDYVGFDLDNTLLQYKVSVYRSFS